MWSSFSFLGKVAIVLVLILSTSLASIVWIKKNKVIHVKAIYPFKISAPNRQPNVIDKEIYDYISSSSKIEYFANFGNFSSEKSAISIWSALSSNAELDNLKIIKTSKGTFTISIGPFKNAELAQNICLHVLGGSEDCQVHENHGNR